MILQYSIIDGYDVRPPAQKTRGSAGIDLHLPSFTNRFITDFVELNKKIIEAENHPAGETLPQLIFAPTGMLMLPPHSRVLVPSGLHFNIPEGWMLEGANRGSVSSIQGIVHGASIIDSDYTGMPFISLINTGNTSKCFKEESAILQVLFREAPLVELVRVSEDEIYKDKVTERGTGALGSTNGV